MDRLSLFLYNTHVCRCTTISSSGKAVQRLTVNWSIMLRKIGKHRLLYSYVMAILVIVFAHNPVFLPGLLFVAAGIAVRFWAAGTIAKNNVLTKSGPYSFMRNPLYFGSFLSALGTFVMIHNWWLMLAFLVGFAIFYGATIKSEEEYLSGRYGEEFQEFKKAVPVFFPRITPAFTEIKSSYSWKRAFYNREHHSLICTIVVVGLIFAVAYLR